VSLGTRLRRYRKLRRFSQEELSQTARVRRSLISELETGTRQDTKSHIVLRLAQALGITVEMLYGESDEDDVQGIPRILVALWGEA
jgi:transcriptional regulator with XRE-family HTH domain